MAHDEQYREEFDTEGEAVAFVEGMEAVVTLADYDHLSHEMFVDGDKWVVEYSAGC